MPFVSALVATASPNGEYGIGLVTFNDSEIDDAEEAHMERLIEAVSERGYVRLDSRPQPSNPGIGHRRAARAAVGYLRRDNRGEGYRRRASRGRL